MFKEILALLESQKRQMMMLDEKEGLADRERSGYDWNSIDDRTGKFVGLREKLYDQTIAWILGPQGRSILFQEMVKLQTPGAIVRITEDTLTTSFATLVTALLPAVRRVYSKLIAMDLVSVQPLSQPAGYIYWIDHLYTNDLPGEGITGGTTRLDQVKSKEYSLSSETGTIREIEFKLAKKLVETEIRKLKFDWSLESEQDVKSQWGIDLESELSAKLGDLLISEVDASVIAALETGAGAGDVIWNPNPPADDKTTADKNAYAQTLYHAIVEANTKIFNKKFRNAGWLLMNGDTYSRFQKLENFNVDPHAQDQIANMGRRYVGNLAGLYKVYVDPWFTANKILLGVRGQSWDEAVAYYAPYIPLFFSEVYIRNDDFTQKSKGAMSRAAYGVIPESATQSPVKNNGLATVSISSS